MKRQRVQEDKEEIRMEKTGKIGLVVEEAA